MAVLYRQIKNQKKIQKILVGLLYKKNYCLCIPDIEHIKPYLEQVSSIWIKKFFLTKNELNLSVIPMFMFIFVKNKRLTADQTKHLLELLHLLIMQADSDTIDQLFFDNKIQQLTWPYYFLNELIKFTHADFVKSQENGKRIMAMATALNLFLEKASLLTVSRFCLNIESSGFNIIQKLLYTIVYESLHSDQILYLSMLSQTIIEKTTVSGIKTLSFQTYHNGYSFIWCALAAWLKLAFEYENLNQIKVNHYTGLIHSIVKKIDDGKIHSILLENKNKGYTLILRYIFFYRMQRTIFSDELVGAFKTFNAWCKKIFSQLTYQQIKLMLKTLPLILNNDRTLSVGDKYEISDRFFDYFFNYSQLKIQEFAALSEAKEQLKESFSSSSNSRILKFFRQIRTKTNWAFFNSLNFQTDQSSIDENSELLTSDCDRLTANYLTV